MNGSGRAAIQIEFYGIPRQRAGRDRIALQLERFPAQLADVLNELARQLPEFGAACVCDGQLRDGYIANLAGDRFLGDPNATLHAGACLLILSADAGG